MAFKLPDLPYEYDALAPHFDAQTMEIHHQKHHNGYTQKLNKAIEGTDLEQQSIEYILKNVSAHPAGVRNNAGGYYNHRLFWNILAPGGGEKLDYEISRVLKAIDMGFGTFDSFKEKFKEAATSQFGSGWAWLCVGVQAGGLYICSTPDQDNPLMDINDFTGLPILGLDVWEHAYYLNYQNRRGDYVDAFFELINWQVVEQRYLAARTELGIV